MRLSRIQKLFVRLSTKQRIGWMRVMPSRKRKRMFGRNKAISNIKVELINAVTGEITTARADADSVAKLKKWLKMRNIRAQFTEMRVLKNSTWSKLSTEEFKDYPVILKVGNLKLPYLIDYVGDRVDFNGKVQCSIFLKTVDNMSYLTLISQKKALLGPVAKPLKVIKKTLKKKKK